MGFQRSFLATAFLALFLQISMPAKDQLFLDSALSVAYSSNGGPPPARIDSLSTSENRSHHVIQNFGETCKNVGKSVFWISTEKDQSRDSAIVPHGSAFLISQSQRLLVTAAHVADKAIEGGSLIAIPSGTATAYKVDRIYYHPGTLRRFALGLYDHSDDPRDGPIMASPTIDIAVLHLNSVGRDLPAECQLATQEELKDLTNKTIAVLGYSGDGADQWPTSDHPAQESFGIGTVKEVVNFNELALKERYQWIKSTMTLAEGSSGGPVILENGHVVGIHSGTVFPYGTSGGVDCVEVFINAAIEIIDFHQLMPSGEQFRSPAHSMLGKMRPDREKIKKVISLVNEAHDLRLKEKYSKAEELCNQALDLNPNYAWAYLESALCNLEICSKNWTKMTDEQRNHVMKLAEYDVKGCFESIREWHYLPGLARAYLNLYRGINDSDKEKIREKMDYVENTIEFLSNSNSKYYDAHAFASYLNCRGHYYNALDEPEEAFQDFYEATAVEPDYARWQLDLATFIENQDWQSIARKHKELADKSRKSKQLLNEIK